LRTSWPSRNALPAPGRLLGLLLLLLV